LLLLLLLLLLLVFQNNVCFRTQTHRGIDLKGFRFGLCLSRPCPTKDMPSPIYFRFSDKTSWFDGGKLAGCVWLSGNGGLPSYWSSLGAYRVAYGK
jgi:hypothetical protein